MGNLACFAVVLPGLEPLAAAELSMLAAHDVEPEEGGVHFTASMEGLFRVNLRCRTATRILLRLAEFKALSFPELYNKAGRIAWERYIAPEAGIEVRAACHGSRLLHSGRTEQAVKDAIRERCARHGVTLSDSREGFRQQVLVRIEENLCTLSLDSSGDRLDRRGYRLASGMAPLRETLAAGILQWMDWRPDQPLLTPMCGSGTFAIEAALMARQVPAALGRDFAFRHWPACRERDWRRVLGRAEAMRRDVPLQIHASDIDAGIVNQARQNAAAAGLSGAIGFAQLDVRQLTVPEGVKGPGLILCNPPYGDRVKGDARGLYQSLGRLLKAQFAGWRVVVLVPDRGCEQALGLPVARRLKLKHGGKWVHALHLADP